MQTNFDTVNPAAQLLALPTSSPLTLGRKTGRAGSVATPANTLLRARAEVVRAAAHEDLVWFALAACAAILVVIALAIG